MPATTTIYIAHAEEPTVTKSTDLDSEPNKDRWPSKVESYKKRNVPLVEPTYATFSLAPMLPAILHDLQVQISTDIVNIALQYSIHACPSRMRREMKIVFPEVAGKENNLLIIPTFQKTTSSMVGYEVETQIEKDAKLHAFYRWGSELVSRLRKQGYWADITDPMSGMALFTASGPSLYPDVEGAEILLRYSQINIGTCFVLSHPHWGTKVYPATAFTLAPINVVKITISAMQTNIHCSSMSVVDGS
ncbi:hypothetical protein IW140_001059 [Coemansia sp. RSA 1813]|nr:hypothetical protein EV178_005712 [Coemansia sp. RSA 1646]KAJ1773095.1 hypothetical protein LPJ74_000834 [Coemansia sp. RSA 1843]KAJ2086044.1 hypothetical protein IW138_005940 [Coemansia sp. RSA 986]KAJ2211168.1 hypothetical protein EV179_005708 [Coemansia sp. RSA 487]KAJ2572019.1 hypothetical protein IW140_001059 [Coemansia sp. RSA 1813]